MRTTQRPQRDQARRSQPQRDQAQRSQPQRDQGQRSQPRPQRPSSVRAGAQPSGRVRVRQEPVTVAALTPAERAKRAMASLNRAYAPPTPAPPARHGPVPHVFGPQRPRRTAAEPPALRRATGIALVAAGAILWLGVHARIAFVATQPAGLVLLAVGLLWIWIPVPDKRHRLLRRFNQLVTYLEWDPAPSGYAKCSLDDLLEPPSSESARGSKRRVAAK